MKNFSLYLPLKRYKIKIKHTDATIKHQYRVKLSGPGIYHDLSKDFILDKASKSGILGALINSYAVANDLIAPSSKLVAFNFNDEIINEYFWSERIAKDFLEKYYGITNYAIIGNSGTKKNYKVKSKNDSLKSRGEKIGELLIEAVASKEYHLLENYIDNSYIAKL